MTLADPPDDPPLDNPIVTTPASRPSFPRSNTAPSWHKTASMESFSSAHRAQSANALTSVPVLRKRHSTYVLSPPQDQPKTPVPGMPPQRPLRNPARASALLVNTKKTPKTRGRPSTATGTPEEVTPWELYPAPAPSEPSVSARGRPSLTTGAIADVTPWELYPVGSTNGRSSLTTGLVEEVTPWELHPVPAITPSRSTLATGLVEEVTPWELFPSPAYESPNSATINEKHSRSSPRVSTSSATPGKTLSELTHIRRRKSTGAKALKTRSNTIPGISAQPSDVSGSHNHARSATSNKHTSAPPSKSAPSTPKLLHRSAHHVAPPLSELPPPAMFQPISSPARTNLKFSTVDRTILEELKRNIRARASQFTIKGAGTTIGSGIDCQGKKHHAYHPKEVPYPRNYGREVLDLDVWETAFCQDICESLTWHVFETPPTKVLDLGCGTGTWILNCARAWKNSQFVGLDIVPLQPDLQQVGSPELASRITWNHSNFLEGLPFPDEEFDFVHIKRIALGVPEDKWDFLFEEVTRVMKPGGAFEMLEEDLFFPGKLIDSDSDSDESDSEHLFSSHSSRRDSTLSYIHRESDLDSAPPSANSIKSEEGFPFPPTPTTSTTLFPTTPSRSNSPVGQMVFNEEIEEEEAQDLLSQVIVDYTPLTPLRKSHDSGNISDAIPPVLSSPPHTARPRLHVKTPTNRNLKFTGSAVSLIMSSMGSVAPPDSLFDSAVEIKKPRARGYSMTAYQHAPSIVAQRVVQNGSHVSPATDSSPIIPPVPTPKVAPFLLRTVPKPPSNPRDHSLLEAIYEHMLGSRFINVSPLALLANSLGLYFKDVRTHPPLQHAFPPVPFKPPRRRSSEEIASESESEGPASDSDDARDAILPSPLPRLNRKRNSHRVSSQSLEVDEAEPISEDRRYLNIRGLIHHSSPYITLDESRINAFSPSTKTSFASGPSSAGKSQRASRLPNTTMHLDLKALNLHLALRAAELVACSESMWEWILEYQAEARSQKASKPTVRPLRSGTIDVQPRESFTSSSGGRSSGSIRASILDLTRDDFDSLVNKFDMDMRDKFSLGSALQDRFSWSVTPSPPTAERKIFDTACEKWDKWERAQLLASLQPGRTSTRSHESKHHPILNNSLASPAILHFSENNDHNPNKIGQDKKKRRASTSSSSTLLPPTRRLSRAMRVFVAWKA